jgi:hypothetical protein
MIYTGMDLAAVAWNVGKPQMAEKPIDRWLQKTE